jgi:hypothetical protein
VPASAACMSQQAGEQGDDRDQHGRGHVEDDGSGSASEIQATASAVSPSCGGESIRAVQSARQGSGNQVSELAGRLSHWRLELTAWKSPRV